MRAIALLALLLLGGCSGVSYVCDKRGRCLETWRDVGAISSVTHSEMTGAPGAGQPPGITSAAGGVVSFIDPLASGVSGVAADARTAAGVSW